MTHCKLLETKEEFFLSYRKKSFSGKWRRRWYPWGPPVDTMKKIDDLITGCRNINKDCIAIEFKIVCKAKLYIEARLNYKVN